MVRDARLRALLTMRGLRRVLARAPRCAIRIAVVARNAKPGGRCRPPGAIPTVDFLLYPFAPVVKKVVVKNRDWTGRRTQHRSGNTDPGFRCAPSGLRTTNLGCRRHHARRRV